MSRVLLVSLAMHRLLLNSVTPPVSVPLLLREDRLLLNHLKHVTGSRYAPWCSGPCASASTSFPDLRVSSTFSLCGTTSETSAPTLLAVLSQLFCHNELLRELFRLLLAMLLFHGFLGPNPWLFANGFSGRNPWLFYFLHGHLARVSFNQIQ